MYFCIQRTVFVNSALEIKMHIKKKYIFSPSIQLFVYGKWRIARQGLSSYTPLYKTNRKAPLTSKSLILCVRMSVDVYTFELAHNQRALLYHHRHQPRHCLVVTCVCTTPSVLIVPYISSDIHICLPIIEHSSIAQLQHAPIYTHLSSLVYVLYRMSL